MLPAAEAPPAAQPGKRPAEEQRAAAEALAEQEPALLPAAKPLAASAPVELRETPFGAAAAAPAPKAPATAAPHVVDPGRIAAAAPEVPPTPARAADRPAEIAAAPAREQPAPASQASAALVALTLCCRCSPPSLLAADCPAASRCIRPVCSSGGRRP